MPGRRYAYCTDIPDAHLHQQKVYKVEPLFENTSLSGGSAEPSRPLLLKYRFPKAYRHATLDKSLTKQRVNHEVKCLTRCLKGGVDVPGVKGVDVQGGVILMDWIDGHGSVREVLGGLPEEGEDDQDDEETEAVTERLRRLQLNEGEKLHFEGCYYERD